MNAPAIIQAASLPALVKSAADKLASATNSAEILDARDSARVVYDAAKSAARFAKAKQAHDEVVSAAYRAQADALEIESLAKRRLADEYDAAQERGEVRSHGERRVSAVETVGFTEIGLTGKDIHEARLIRDAEQADPGIIRRTLDAALEAGHEPTRAAIKREITPAPKPRVADDSLWLWGRLRDMESNGYFKADPATLLLNMTPQMRDDVKRLAPLVRNLMEELEIRFVPT